MPMSVLSALPSVGEITHPAVVEALRKKMLEMVHLPPEGPTKLYPGTLPSLMTELDLEQLQDMHSDHVASFRLAGQRMMLYCFTQNMMERMILADLHHQHLKYITNVVVDPDIWKGTILDGVYLEKEKRFVVHDCRMGRGLSLAEPGDGECDYTERIDAIKIVLSTWKFYGADGFKVVTHHFGAMSDLPWMSRVFSMPNPVEPKTGFPVQGLVIWNVTPPYRYGRATDIVAWKAKREAEFRLRVHNDDSTRADLLALKTMQKAIVLGQISTAGLLPDASSVDKKIVTCCFVDGKWVPVRIRSDRLYPDTVGRVRQLETDYFSLADFFGRPSAAAGAEAGPAAPAADSSVTIA